jgi:cytochrome b561
MPADESKRRGTAAMTPKRYAAAAIALHWIIAALIFTNLVLGWRMGFLHGLAKFNIFQLHKSVGLTVLVFSLLRLAWRLFRPPPPQPGSLTGWERTGSAVVHWSLYGLMIAMPLSGWALASASPLNIPTLVFHVLPWPDFPGVHELPAGSKHVVEAFTQRTHLIFAWGMMMLLLMHVAAALKHQFIDRDEVLARMVPGLPQSRRVF